MRRIEVKKGDLFGDLTVVREEDIHITSGGNKKRIFLCECVCGNKTLTALNSLSSGKAKSCGCSRSTHKLGGTSFYNTWYHMLDRCINRKSDAYKYYGGRGIEVSARWMDVSNFNDDMGADYHKHHLENNGNTEIDRVDNNGKYCKENCRWVTRAENNLNRRNTVFVEYKDEKIAMVKFARKYNLTISTCKARMRIGATAAQLLLSTEEWRNR